MADTWGDDGPPDDAYERHSRDLAAVTAEYAAYLDDLPTRLTTEFACAVRAATVEEVDWLLNGSPLELDHAFVVHPGVDGCATLLIGRGRFEGGTTAQIGFGVATRASLPSCFCDACDEDSESLISETEQYVRIVTSGCREFRRPNGPVQGADPRDGPWMESGYVWAGGRSSGASAGVRGEPFMREWREWPRRSSPR